MVAAAEVLAVEGTGTRTPVAVVADPVVHVVALQVHVGGVTVPDGLHPGLGHPLQRQGHPRAMPVATPLHQPVQMHQQVQMCEVAAGPRPPRPTRLVGQPTAGPHPQLPSPRLNNSLRTAPISGLEKTIDICTSLAHASRGYKTRRGFYSKQGHVWLQK